MKSLSSRRHVVFHAPDALFAIFLAATCLLHADVPGVTGSITSTESISRYGFSQTETIQLQGTNFSLNSFISSDNLVNFNDAASSVTFYPKASASDLMPFLFGANPGYNDGTLIYNGVSYTNLQVALNMSGAPATVANTGSNPEYFFAGTVANIPFTMTGVVSVYALPPNPQGVQLNPPLFTVNFSGGGLYGASVTGSFPQTGSPGSIGNSSYQFLANPVGFTTDTTTQGTWSGKYGGEGYLIANGPVSLPGYAAVSVTQASAYTWAPQTSDVRAFQDGLGATSRIASAYYGNSFDINIDFTDTNAHRVALYLLDFDTTSRSETLTLKNADTGVTLDTETIASFQNGIYAIWVLQGNVSINVKRAGGASAVVSGIFFGEPGTIMSNSTAIPTSSAAFHGINTAYQGAWESHYGSAGYLIANGPSSTPSLAALNIAGATIYTWAAQTTDPRALQINPQDTAGIASAYTQYPSKSFEINVSLPLGEQQMLSLYLLDWDNAGRAETVTITDLSTGTVLDTETASAFQGGIYLTWTISGSVVVTVTPSGTSSPVVSGIFLN
jgi:hypothetical protein